MTRTMYDSTTAADCPADGDLYAGYIDGGWPSYGDMVKNFPGKVHVRIAVSAWHGPAEVGDVENGDLTPQQAPGFVTRQRALGVPRVALYVNRGNLDAVDQELHDAGVATDVACLWVATDDGTEYTTPSPHGYQVVACQAKDPALTGGHYDRSVVYDDFWPSASHTVVPTMFNPPLHIDEPVVASLSWPHGGVILLSQDGAVYAFEGAPYKGGANGKTWFAGRQAARIDYMPAGTVGDYGEGYTITDTAGETYHFDGRQN